MGVGALRQILTVGFELEGLIKHFLFETAYRSCTVTLILVGLLPKSSDLVANDSQRKLGRGAVGLEVQDDVALDSLSSNNFGVRQVDDHITLDRLL